MQKTCTEKAEETKASTYRTPENEIRVQKPSSEDPFDIEFEFEKSTGAYLAANIERLLKVKSDLHPLKFRFDICDEAVRKKI